MKRYYLLFIFALLIIPSVSAELIFARATNINISIPCAFNQTQCSTGATCNWTVYDSDYNRTKYGHDLNVSDSFFHIDLNSSESSENGDYLLNMWCVDQGLGDAVTIDFKITPSGRELTLTQAIIYILFFVFISVLLVLSIRGAIKIPWKDTRNDEGRLISVNDMKWLKLACMVFSYLIILFMTAIIRQVTGNFLFFEGATKLFNVIYVIQLVTLVPLAIIVPWFILVLVIADKKTKKFIERGLNPE